MRMRLQLGWLALALTTMGCSSKTEQIHAEYKMLTSAVYASGTLVPEQEYKVLSGVEGYLDQVLVQEGDHVSKGQLLFTLSSEVRQAQEQGARAVVQKTASVVNSDAPVYRELRNQIELAAIKKSQDSLQYRRYKALLEQDAISKNSYEKVYLQYQASIKDYQNLHQRLQEQRLSGNLQLQQAKNQLSVASAQTDYGRLTSFVNGIVYEVYKQKGDLVTQNQPLALVGDGEMIARLLVDEDDLSKIAVGQKVLITMDAYPDKVYKARISKIYPLLNKVEQSFRVDALLDETPPVAMYGLNLEANIVIAENRKVMVLPKRALLKGDSIMVMVNGNEAKVKIKKGIEDDQYVEILSGLGPETIVIVAP